MKKIYSRLFVFFLGVPAIVAIILLLPWQNHLALNVLVLLAIGMGAFEVAGLLSVFQVVQNRALLITLCLLYPLGTYLEMIKKVPEGSAVLFFVVAASVLFIRQIFARKDSAFSQASWSMASGIMVLIYPGFFGSFLMRITSLPSPSIVFLAFIIMVFANDTGAYVLGMLFGAKNRGIFQVSPGKSMVGFVAGFLLSISAALIFFRFFPQAFGDSFAVALTAGILVGICVIFGDLIGSALKRSAQVKDSGTIIPGRGGILDSIDSVLFSAPAYFLLIQLSIQG